MRSIIRRVLITILAVIGALTLFGRTLGLVIRQLAGDGYGRVVANGKPVPGVPVFLDRGSAALERFITDTAGAFTFPLELHEIRRSVWLICAPGMIPMVGSREENQAGPTTYQLTPLPDSTWGFYLASGWRGPVPRECPRGTESWSWRYPLADGEQKDSFTLAEPEWRR